MLRFQSWLHHFSMPYLRSRSMQWVFAGHRVFIFLHPNFSFNNIFYCACALQMTQYIDYFVGQVVTGGWDKMIKCWDSRSMKTLSGANTVSVGAESMSLCGFIAMVAVGTSVNIYDLRKFNSSFYSKCVDIQIRCFWPYLDQGFAAGSAEGRIFFRCLPKANEKRHDLAAVNDIVFSPSNYGVFLTGTNDGYVTIWNAQSKKRVFEMPKLENNIASLSYSREGQFLAIASSYTYQEATELLIDEFNGHLSQECLSFFAEFYAVFIKVHDLCT
ncbi:transducin/WD40 repeat-like superfamily protein [Artemisia annua]|uniref:Transducin/WD40 repeat-like superfamily protein n=1 Tax=Artemisia annua TaxID=35608 RepID=A0A2U1NNA0_ARTAN|nr:transducin/WD40 repeat-like superfamily protein [Artemisia annua]